MRRVASAFTLDAFERRPQDLLASRSEAARRLRRLQAKAARRARLLAQKYEEQYHMHENLLLFWFSRHSSFKEDWVSNPLSRWRTAWRTLGVMLLLANGACSLSVAWVDYRCDVDPLCDQTARRCPGSLWEASAVAAAAPFEYLKLGTLRPGRGISFGCRRELLDEFFSASVRAFSVVEIALGLRTAWYTGRSRRGPLQGHWYGTSDGAAAQVLFSLDVLLLLSPWRADWQVCLGGSSRESDRAIDDAAAPASGGDEESRYFCELIKQKWTPKWLPLAGWCKDVHRAVRAMPVVSHIDGFKRLKALKPMPAPIQYCIDATIKWLLPTKGDEIRALPTVRDILFEGELLQAFLAHFARSIKVLGLLLSTFKATRVRRGARALRRDRAARRITLLLRRQLAARRVNQLRQKHAWRTLLDDLVLTGDEPEASPLSSPSPSQMHLAHGNADPETVSRMNGAPQVGLGSSQSAGNLSELHHRRACSSGGEGWHVA
jgi:hypothetical protein